MKTSTTSGFTLLELLVAIAVSTILLTIGIPSFMSMIAQNQRVSHTADVYNAFNFARAEAIARNQPVVMCKSSNQSSCNAAATWADGWLIYANADNSINSFDPANGDQLLRAHDGFKQFTLTSTTLTDRAVFLPTGRAQVDGELRLCPQSDALEGRSIQITSTGRPRTVTYDCS